MTGARGDALEWALALAQAPGERYALRQRPLPDGIEALLQIAAGRQGEVLRGALARCGEPEAELVEVVRFYLREVLFHSGADAYRMLGLAHDASDEQIKGHHRLLQQWLHPDRHTSDWDAIFAGRVNAAWNALRTRERRAEYDASHPTTNQLPPVNARWVAPRVVGREPMQADATSARWRRRAPVLALFAACGLLGVAALRETLREPHSGYSAGVEDTRPKAEADAVSLQLPKPVAQAEVRKRATPAAARRVATRSPRSAAVTRQAAVTTRPSNPKVLPAPVAVSKPSPPIALPRRAVAVAAAPTPAPAPITPPPPMRVAVTQSAAWVARVTAAPPAAPAMAPVESPAQVAKVPSPPPAKPIEQAIAPPAAPTERVQQAQRTGRQLLAFLSGPGTSVPPIWDSLASQQRAVRLRASLHASGNTRAGEPQWRVAGEDAALKAGFGDNAQVRAQLVWREQRWLVSGVALEQAP